MAQIPPLSALGPRIAILGPSNSGKSTLAVAIGRKLGIPVVHLDRLRHLPNTDWRVRPDAEFAALHEEAIGADAWVMDGNYSAHFPTRFARATGIIVLRGGRWANFARYLRRTLFQRERAGQLEGAQDSLKWGMVHWVLIRAHKNNKRYADIVRRTGLPTVWLRRMRELDEAYRVWNLQREP